MVSYGLTILRSYGLTALRSYSFAPTVRRATAISRRVKNGVCALSVNMKNGLSHPARPCTFAPSLATKVNGYIVTLK